MRSVRQMLVSKRPEVYSVGPDDAVVEAIKLMALKEVGAVLVMQSGRLVGIVSERDYARKIVLHGRSSSDTPVRDIMTADVITVGLNHDVDSCMKVVTDRRVRHLPVLDAGQVVGVVSIGDLVKAKIEDQQAELEQLQRYIAS